MHLCMPMHNFKLTELAKGSKNLIITPKKRRCMSLHIICKILWLFSVAKNQIGTKRRLILPFKQHLEKNFDPSYAGYFLQQRLLNMFICWVLCTAILPNKLADQDYCIYLATCLGNFGPCKQASLCCKHTHNDHSSLCLLIENRIA